MVDNKNRDTTHRDCSLHLLIDKVPSTLIVIYVHYIYIFVALHQMCLVPVGKMFYNRKEMKKNLPLLIIAPIFQDIFTQSAKFISRIQFHFKYPPIPQSKPHSRQSYMCHFRLTRKILLFLRIISNHSLDGWDKKISCRAKRKITSICRVFVGKDQSESILIETFFSFFRSANFGGCW